MFFFFFDDENIEQGESLFDSIKHVNEYGQEYWTARELFGVLGYKQWRDFKKVIEKAVRSCETSDNKVSDHFARTRKIVKAGATSKPIEDYNLSRYACYLIAMNGNPSVEEIALAQTYFAVKTRQQELRDHRAEDDIRRQRIRWIRAFIEHADCKPDNCDECEGMKMWSAPYKGKIHRIKILLEEEKYIVILEKREKYILLITAYYADHTHRLEKLLKEYDQYKAKSAST